jgi:hypothetical protein
VQVLPFRHQAQRPSPLRRNNFRLRHQVRLIFALCAPDCCRLLATRCAFGQRVLAPDAHRLLSPWPTGEFGKRLGVERKVHFVPAWEPSGRQELAWCKIRKGVL